VNRERCDAAFQLFPGLRLMVMFFCMLGVCGLTTLKGCWEFLAALLGAISQYFWYLLGVNSVCLWVGRGFESVLPRRLTLQGAEFGRGF
jgi:hypothetical protein